MSPSHPGVIEAFIRPKGNLWVGNVRAIGAGTAGVFFTEDEAQRFIVEFMNDYRNGTLVEADRRVVCGFAVSLAGGQ